MAGNRGDSSKPDPIVTNTPVANNIVVFADTLGNIKDGGAAVTGGTVTHTPGALTANQLVIGNGGGDIGPLGAAGTTTQVLHGNAAGAPTYGAVSLVNDVTGTLPVGNGGTGITALGSGVATFLGTPSSANLASAVTGGTGSGALMFGTSPTVTTSLIMADTANIVTNTGTGTKIGTATTQKIGFWNTTPIIQPTTSVTAATFVANTSGIANDTATFDGYTLGQVVKALRNIGLLA